MGPATWKQLTGTQRRTLKSALRQRFAGMLAPPKPATADVAWSAEIPDSHGGTDAILGLRIGGKGLKTRWKMRKEGSRWRVRDVILTDPGVSLMESALATLGPSPVNPRSGKTRMRKEVVPPLALAVAIGLAVLLAAPRIDRRRRRILHFAAIAAAAFFAASALVAAFRIANERYAVEIGAPAEPWRRSQELAVVAEGEGETERRRELFARAIAGGGPPGPGAYEIGLAARERGDRNAARTFFQLALSASVPAPGAGRELAALDAEDGRLLDAEKEIDGYLETAGPDPEALSLQAVIKTNLGKTVEAVAAIGGARRLIGGGRAGAELEAKIRGRAADAAGAVAALQSLPAGEIPDREALRSDPAYLPIATDPVWVRFLNEGLKD